MRVCAYVFARSLKGIGLCACVCVCVGEHFSLGIRQERHSDKLVHLAKYSLACAIKKRMKPDDINSFFYYVNSLSNNKCLSYITKLFFKLFDNYTVLYCSLNVRFGRARMRIVYEAGDCL